MRPDLDDPEARAAYHRELLGVGRGMRRVGFAASLLALALLMGPRMGGPWMLARCRRNIGAGRRCCSAGRCSSS